MEKDKLSSNYPIRRELTIEEKLEDLKIQFPRKKFRIVTSENGEKKVEVVI